MPQRGEITGLLNPSSTSFIGYKWEKNPHRTAVAFLHLGVGVGWGGGDEETFRRAQMFAELSIEKKEKSLNGRIKRSFPL